MKSIKLNNRIVDHLIQAVLIFASVFIAFWMNDYRMNKTEEKFKNEALTAIKTELEKNLDILERWSPYHSEISERAGKVIENEMDTITQLNFYRLYDSQKGYRREFITDFAWQFLNQSELSIPIEIKLMLNKTYHQQKYVDNAFDKFFKFLDSRAMYDNKKLKENYVIYYNYITEIYYQELAMIENYKYAIKKLKQNH